MRNVQVPAGLTGLVSRLSELDLHGFTGSTEQHWKEGRVLRTFEEPHRVPEGGLSGLLSSGFEGKIEAEISGGKVLLKRVSKRKDLI